MYSKSKPIRPFLVACVSVWTLTSGAALASTGDMRFMQMGPQREAPLAFLLYCNKQPTECGLDAQRAKPAQADAAVSLASLDQALRQDDSDSDAGLATGATGATGPVPAVVAAARSLPGTVEPATASEPQARGVTPLVWDRSSKKLLDRVNRSVNRRIRSRSDLDTTGEPERWSLPVVINGRAYGDCEDYALAKKHELTLMGVPMAALSMAVARTPAGLVHAVLIVTTDQGEYVLDNLSDKLKPWYETRYTWVMRQRSGDSLEWARLDTFG